MDYKIYIYAIMLFVTSYALSGINFTGWFKQGHVLEAKIFVILMSLAISYLASSFVLAFITN